MYQRFERIEGPIGPLDKQVQRSSLIDDLDIQLKSAIFEARVAWPDMTYNGYVYEIVPDGAGVKHYNLTVHYHTAAPTLDPTNLNDAPQDFFGNTLDEAQKTAKGVGLKEKDLRTMGR